jgi:hypothetical protein
MTTLFFLKEKGKNAKKLVIITLTPGRDLLGQELRPDRLRCQLVWQLLAQQAGQLLPQEDASQPAVGDDSKYEAFFERRKYIFFMS